MTKYLTPDDILPKRVPLNTLLDELGLEPAIKPAQPKRLFAQPGRSVAKAATKKLRLSDEDLRILAAHRLDKARANGDTHAVIYVKVRDDGTIEILDEGVVRADELIARELQQLPPIPLDEGFMPTAHRRARDIFRRFWEAEEPKPYSLKESPFAATYERRLPPRVLFKGKR